MKFIFRVNFILFQTFENGLELNILQAMSLLLYILRIQ